MVVCHMCCVAHCRLRYRLDAQPKCLRSSEYTKRKLRVIITKPSSASDWISVPTPDFWGYTSGGSSSLLSPARLRPGLNAPSHYLNG